MTVALTADRPLRELTELGDKTVRPQLERVGGVGEAAVVGGIDRAISVWIDAERLAAYQIPITAVRQAISRQNADVPGGNVTTGREELTLRTMGRFIDPRSMNDLVVANLGGSPIRLRDVGRVEDGTREQRSLARLNGTPTVSIEIRRPSGANTSRGYASRASWAGAGATALGREAGDHPRPVALHRGGAARDSDAPHPGEHPRLARRPPLHALLALDADRGRRHPGLGHLHLRHDAGARLHPQLGDDAAWC